MKLSDLFEIHEYGIVIKSKSGSLIQIPPRPGMLRAYNKFLRKKRETQFKDNTRMRQLINAYIKDANEAHIAEETKRMMKGLEKFEREE